MSGPARGRTDAEAPARLTDDEIAALIAAAVHAPYRTVWPDHENEVWRSLRRTLERAVATHARALAELPQEDSGVGDGKAGEPALARYRNRVARDVLKPVHVALRHAPLAALLQRSLDSAAAEAREALARLPAVARAPVSPTALESHTGQRAWTAVNGSRRGRCGRSYGGRRSMTLLWRGSLPSTSIAPCSRTRSAPFGRASGGRAVWLARLERAWSGWIDVVLATSHREPGQGPEREAVAPPPHRDAGATLQAELEALRDDMARVSGAGNRGRVRTPDRYPGRHGRGGRDLCGRKPVGRGSGHGPRGARRSLGPVGRAKRRPVSSCTGCCSR